MEGPVSRRRFCFFNWGKKLLERPKAPLGSFFWSSLRSQKLLGKAPWPSSPPWPPWFPPDLGLYIVNQPLFPNRRKTWSTSSALFRFTLVFCWNSEFLCAPIAFASVISNMKNMVNRDMKNQEKLKTHTKFLKLEAIS